MQGRFANLKSWRFAALAAVALVGPAIGCSEILGVTSDRHLSQPAVDSGEGLDAGMEAAGPWDCLDQPPETLDPTATVDFTLLAYDAVKPFSESSDGGSDLTPITYSALAGVSARVCPSLLDPTCDTTGSPWVMLSDAGLGDFKVHGDFGGTFQVQRSDLIPMTYYPGQVLAGAATERGSVSMMNAFNASLIGQELKVPLDLGPDSGAGMIFLGVYDCYDHRAPGVTFGISNPGPTTVIFYLAHGFPSTTAVATEQGLGGGGAINVPAGTSILTATLSGRRIGTANVVIRSGAIVQLSFRTRTH